MRAHPLLKKRNKSGWQTHELFNQYYDTANRDLAAARVALRLRRDGEQIIQTLKSRGQSVAGLSERNEWDWYLQKAKLDTGLLTDDCWPASGPVSRAPSSTPKAGIAAITPMAKAP